MMLLHILHIRLSKRDRGKKTQFELSSIFLLRYVCLSPEGVGYSCMVVVVLALHVGTSLDLWSWGR